MEDELKALTFNLYFENIENEKRMSYLGTMINRLNPAIITFQEVTRNLLAIFSKAKWFKKYYCQYPISKNQNSQKDPLSGYFVLILSKFPIMESMYFEFSDSKMERALLAVIINVPIQLKEPEPTVREFRICVGTTHLESPPLNSEVRINQLQQSFQALIEFSGKDPLNPVYGTLLMGDMNLTPEDPEPNLPPNWCDLWRQLNLDDPGFTFDGRRNNLAKRFQSRLDRVYVNLNAWNGQRLFTSRSIELVATDKIRAGLWISDHFALFTTLETTIGTIQITNEPVVKPTESLLLGRRLNPPCELYQLQDEFSDTSTDWKKVNNPTEHDLTEALVCCLLTNIPTVGSPNKVFVWLGANCKPMKGQFNRMKPIGKKFGKDFLQWKKETSLGSDAMETDDAEIEIVVMKQHQEDGDFWECFESRS